MELSISTARPLAVPAAMGLLANPKKINHEYAREPLPQLRSSQRIIHKAGSVLRAVSPLQCSENESSVSFEDFLVSVQTEDDRLIKIRVTVTSMMTDSTFDKVFSKNVAAAQPLPGFRRMKGGKTRDIPKDVALHLIGPSKVKKETIKNIINFTIAEYVRKEGLNASKNLKVLQTYEELEATFEPGKQFCFDAALHLQ